jgi:polar amino acid transport system substrate-binding protein
MNLAKWGIALIALVLAACAAPEHGRESSITAQAVAPSGTLPVGVSVGPTGNTFRATPDPATNRPNNRGRWCGSNFSPALTGDGQTG